VQKVVIAGRRPANTLFNLKEGIGELALGAELFGEIWPLLQVHIPDRARRQEFLRQMLALFLEWDVDPENVAGLHPEIRSVLAALGVAVDEAGSGEDDVAGCVRQLADPAEKARVTAAQALAFFVHQASNPDNAAGVALRALAGALRDASVKVRRAAAKSIAELLADDFLLPSEVRAHLEAAASERDEVVRKRVAGALKRVEKTGRSKAGRTRRCT
jgi:hypothetical protein